MSAASVALLCTVVEITDGDTITVRCGQSDQEKVRLTQIDAPERKQAFGTKAKKTLSSMTMGRYVQVVSAGTDRYGRILGDDRINDTSVNFEMVRRGYAWCYLEYLKDRSCLQLQEKAKADRLGLWADAGAIAPWSFRKEFRKSLRSGSKDESAGSVPT